MAFRPGGTSAMAGARRRGALTGDPRIDRRDTGQYNGAPGQSAESSIEEAMITGRRLARLPFSDARAMIPYEPVQYQGPDRIQAPSVAGRRMTDQGTYGDMNSPTDVWQDLRMQALRASVVPDIRVYDTRLRVAGIIRGTEIFNSAPMPDRPWLSLRSASSVAGGSSAFANDLHVSLTAGMSEGMEAHREFFLGGGNTASFKLSGWENVKVRLLDSAPEQELQYAWLADGLQNSNQDLVLPQEVEFGASPFVTPLTVPEGAFELIVGFPANPTYAVPLNAVAVVDFYQPGLWALINPFRTYVGDGTTVGGASYRWGEPIPVSGTRFAIPSILVPPADEDPQIWQICWRLRPI